jgi:hypothetical protein
LSNAFENFNAGAEKMKFRLIENFPACTVMLRMALREWAVPNFSKGKVDKAGVELFSHDLFAYNDSLEIVDNWRSAHNYPLNIFQDGLRKRAKPIFKDCIIAQRIKRLSSITAKLERFPTMRLSMMQDIGGCRAVDLIPKAGQIIS